MAGATTYTYSPESEPKLRSFLAERGFRFTEAPYAFWRAESPECAVTFYRSGKLVIQGAQVESWSQLLSPSQFLDGAGAARFGKAVEKLDQKELQAWIGSDESGKGDYFGPLVVCATRVERSQLDLLAELGVADCKLLTDPQVNALAPGLKALCPYSLVVVNPDRYNTLRQQMDNNLNRLLAWAHARAIEDLLARHPDTTTVLVDRFGPESRMIQALMTRGREVRLLQRPKAEEDPAVAVASILARHEFLRRLKALSKSYSMTFPKGAGLPVIAAARQFVASHGKEALAQVAKVHFKTTLTALG
ncbi:MAG: ribonuclease HIII [Bradymonadales bacterium]|nr:ribonuclease HIII [Bradymonadales bacterium]